MIASSNLILSLQWPF